MTSPSEPHVPFGWPDALNTRRPAFSVDGLVVPYARLPVMPARRGRVADDVKAGSEPEHRIPNDGAY